MSKLQAFMSAHAAKIENTKVVVSNRFTDEKGKPIEWELRGITSSEDDQIRNASFKKVMKNGRLVSEDLDYTLYLANLTSSCVVFPDLRDVELQNSYGAMGEVELLKVMLSPGEYANLAEEVQILNGFDQSDEDLEEEAKN